MSPTKRIPWCDYCNRVMFQFLATHRRCPRNCGKDIQSLARLMDCTYSGFEDAVWPKIKSSLRQKLLELHRDGNIVIYVDDDGVEQAYWPAGTDCWREDSWDGRRDCRVDPSIREHLEAHGTLEAMDRGRNRRGAYVFARDSERRRDDSEPPPAGQGGRPSTATSDDGHPPPSAASDDDSPPPSAMSDSNRRPPSELSGEGSPPPSELSDDGLDADVDSVMSDDPFRVRDAFYSALHGSWAHSYSDEQVSPQGGYRHARMLTNPAAQADGPVSQTGEGAQGQAAPEAQEAREVGTGTAWFRICLLGGILPPPSSVGLLGSRSLSMGEHDLVGGDEG